VGGREISKLEYKFLCSLLRHSAEKDVKRNTDEDSKRGMKKVVKCRKREKERCRKKERWRKKERCRKKERWRKKETWRNREILRKGRCREKEMPKREM